MGAGELGKLRVTGPEFCCSHVCVVCVRGFLGRVGFQEYSGRLEATLLHIPLPRLL